MDNPNSQPIPIIPKQQPARSTPPSDPATPPAPTPAQPNPAAKTSKTDQDIQDIVISDVTKSMLSYVTKRFKLLIPVAIVAVVLWYILLLMFVIPFIMSPDNAPPSGSRDNRPGLIVFLLIIPYLVSNAYYLWLKRKFELVFLEEFAKSNNYSFDATGSVDETYGSIFRAGSSSQKVSDIITGEYQGAALRMFICETTIGSGRSRHDYLNTVLELDLKGKLPNLMLVSHRSFVMGFNIASIAGLTNKISLEGDFDKDFTLYSQPNGQVDALEIFSPDIMEITQRISKGHTIEFVANRIYIYSNGYISKGSDLSHVFDVAKALIKKVQPIAQRLIHDSSITEPVQKSPAIVASDIPFTSSPHLKRNVIVIVSIVAGALFIAMPVAIFLIFFFISLFTH
jgi:hypothetical protein